jgi:hypothetical protein
MVEIYFECVFCATLVISGQGPEKIEAPINAKANRIAATAALQFIKRKRSSLLPDDTRTPLERAVSWKE